MTRDPRDIPAAGGLRDRFGRIQFVVKTPNEALDAGDVLTPSGPFDADGREHIALIGVVASDGGSGPSDDAVTVGATAAGSDGVFPASGNHSFVRSTVAPYDCKATILRAWLKADGPGGVGPQGMRAVAYGEASGSIYPNGPLLQVSSTHVETSTNDGSVHLVEIALPAPVVPIPAGSAIHYGLHFQVGPGANQVFNIMYDSATADSTVANSDNFDDGSANTFGTQTAGYAWLGSFQLVLEPMDASLGGAGALQAREDGVALGAATEINAGSGITGTLLGGVLTLDAAVSEIPLTDSDESYLIFDAELGAIRWQPRALPTSGAYWQTDFTGALVAGAVVESMVIDTRSPDFAGPNTFGEYGVYFESDQNVSAGTLQILTSPDNATFTLEKGLAPALGSGAAAAIYLASFRGPLVQRYVMARFTMGVVAATAVKFRTGFTWGTMS